MQTTTPKNIWSDQVKQWNRLASPQKPCNEDIDLMRQGLQAITGACLLLGVTPEYYGLSDNLIAADNNEAMIKGVWPGNHKGKNAVQGDWLQLPFKANTFDAVMGDGSLSVLQYPLSYELLFRHLKGVLKPRGKLLLRLYVTPSEGEACSAICRDAREGKIGSFHAFKWRLAMALISESGKSNIRVRDIYDTFNHFFPDREILSEQTSWDREDIATIEVYRESPAIYSFPQLSDVRIAFQPYFREIKLLNGTYELAERCPVLILESS